MIHMCVCLIGSLWIPKDSLLLLKNPGQPAQVVPLLGQERELVRHQLLLTHDSH